MRVRQTHILTLLRELAGLNRSPQPYRKGQYSIRINDQYRVCFGWTDQGPIDVEIVDYR